MYYTAIKYYKENPTITNFLKPQSKGTSNVERRVFFI
jgi:hypothetical protein